jgi:DNA topoisomerase-1
MSSEPVVGYCVKCKAKREIASPKAVFLGGQGRPATQGVCPVCGTSVTRFGRTAAHDALTPPPRTVGSAPAQPRKTTGPKMVIVESPAKARTVGRFLGRGYAVEASVGHIRDLPVNRMGVDVDHDFEPHYVIPVKKKEVVKKLQARAKEASALYLATDPDREGEAIAWHLRTALKQQVQGIPVQRVEFHEITQQAVDDAFAHPRDIDQLRVDSQQARRILDRVVGYTLSPLLRDKMGRKNLSAGRVQSVALRLICEREREIQAFVPVEYWSIEAELKKKQEAEGKAQESFIARLVKIRGKDPDLKNRADAQAIVDDLEGALYAVSKVTRRDVRRNPMPPFMTSTLQQEASRKLRFTARQTMAIAQALYEGKEIGGGERGGLITYMRTDSVQVAESAQAEARQWVVERFGREYLPPQPPQYKTRAKGAQEAHEAIRPTSVQREPDDLKPYLTRDELRLYTLIWRRFVASQMAPAILDQTTVDILAGPAAGEKPYLFRAVGTVIKFPGFLKVYEESREEDEKAEEEGEGVRLPPLREGEMLDLVRLLPKQHFTQPPPRYSDATLIRALEEYGIGRPSTYAPILTTLLDRAYVERVDKKLIPTALGFTVNDLLVEYFADVVNVGFTAEMEEKLDEIATGEQAWVPMLREFYGPFSQTVVVAQEKMPHVDLKPEPTGDLCPECGQPLLIRHGRNGKFIGCSGFPKCRYTAPLPIPGVTCPQCGGAVVEKRTRRGRRFYSCANWRPDDDTACQWTAWKLPKEAALPRDGDEDSDNQ